MIQKKAFFVGGGTGGHINSALALGKYFAEQNFKIHYFSGKRELDYKLFADQPVSHLDSLPLRYKNPIKILKSLWVNLGTFFSTLLYLKKEKPSFVFGVGGYVCGPVLLAAFILKIPVFILEQNSVMGLTNLLLSKISTKIFVHFAQTRGLQNSNKVVVSGNPIRSAFYQKLAQEKNQSKDSFNVLVFGGSLGAKAINECIVQFKKKDSDFPISIRHQTGLKNEVNTQGNPGVHVDYQPLPYLDHIEAEYAWSDLIICRSGASSVSELRVVKKPVILIPYPGHKDRHQYYNAEFLKAEVDFDVTVSSVENLMEDDFKLLSDCIAKHRNFLYDKTKETHSADSPQCVDGATVKIFKEVMNYV